MRFLMITGWLTAYLLLSLPALAGQPLIRDDGPLTDGDFKVLFKPVRQEYPVQSDIRFTVWANQPFYLQLYARDDDGGLIPILKQDTKNPSPFQAKMEFTVPDSKIHFQAACPGSQKVVMVASTSPLGIKTGETAGPDLQTRSAFLEKEQPARVTTEIDIRIEKIPPRPVLQTGKDRYALHDYIPVTVSAPADGFVNLWVINPDSGRTHIGVRRVEKDRQQTLTFRADPPAGHHTLVALFDAGTVQPAYSSLAAAGYGKCPDADGFSELSLNVVADTDPADATRAIIRVREKETGQDTTGSPDLPQTGQKNNDTGDTLWNNLHNLVANAPHPLNITLNRQVFTLNQNLVIQCRVDRPGYLNIISYSRGEAGAVLIFPNRYQQDNRVEPGSAIRVPAANARFTLPARPPLGKVMVLALLTRQPLDLRQNNIDRIDQLFAALRPGTMRNLTLVNGFESLLAGGMVVTEIR